MDLETIITNIGISILYAVYFLAVMFVLNTISNYRIKKIFDPIKEIEENNNLAFVFRRSGMYIGTSIGMYGLLDNSWTYILCETLLLFMFMFLGLYIVNKFFLSAINNDEQIKKQNVAVGIIEFGNFISIGILAYVSFLGEGSLIESIFYFFLGQILMLIIFLIYNGNIKFDLFKNIQYHNHIPSAILTASIFISLALILKGAIEGPEAPSFSVDLISFFISALNGIILLVFLANKLIDKLFLPTSTIEQELKDNNIAAMVLIGALKISISLAISMVII